MFYINNNEFIIFHIALGTCSSPNSSTSRHALKRLSESSVTIRQDITSVPYPAPKTLNIDKINTITKDFATWYNYAYYQVPLARNFKALNVKGQPISKEAFLRQLATNNVLALLNGSEHNRPVYQLYHYTGKQLQIQRISQQFAQEALVYVHREGQKMPPFKFTDIKGKTYTSISTRGKVVVIKCWFVECAPCVKEFPEDNALVAKYQNNKDVVFISLADNKLPKLQKFLRTHELNYAVIPDSRDYMEKRLGVIGYPTYFVVGREGKIVHITTASVGYVASAIETTLQPSN